MTKYCVKTFHSLPPEKAFERYTERACERAIDNSGSREHRAEQKKSKGQRGGESRHAATFCTRFCGKNSGYSDVSRQVRRPQIPITTDVTASREMDVNSEQAKTLYKSFYFFQFCLRCRVFLKKVFHETEEKKYKKK